MGRARRGYWLKPGVRNRVLIIREDEQEMLVQVEGRSLHASGGRSDVRPGIGADWGALQPVAGAVHHVGLAGPHRGENPSTRRLELPDDSPDLEALPVSPAIVG